MLQPFAKRSSAAARLGFTLIELLVVIAIIVLLIGLTTAGILKFLAKGPDLLDVQDTQEMSKALEMFKTNMKTYPPGVIRLYPNYTDYFKNLNLEPDLDAESLIYLSRMWPNLGSNWTNINWGDPNNGPGFPANGVKLSGPQCLVYFLGGPSGQSGFATNPKHPMLVGANQDRKKWYQFKPERLEPAGSAFPVYTSNHGTKMPFLYFAPAKAGYNTLNGKLNALTCATHSVTLINFRNGTDTIGPMFKNDNGKVKYYNPDRFQLMAAGVDGCFDTFVTTMSNAPAVGQFDGEFNATAPAGLWKDNRVNFSDTTLGAGVN